MGHVAKISKFGNWILCHFASLIKKVVDECRKEGIEIVRRMIDIEKFLIEKTCRIACLPDCLSRRGQRFDYLPRCWLDILIDTSDWHPRRTKVWKRPQNSKSQSKETSLKHKLNTLSADFMKIQFLSLRSLKTKT